MPKKKVGETAEAQSERFREAVRAAIDAGELNPTEADERFEQVLAAVVSQNGRPTPSADDDPHAEP